MLCKMCRLLLLLNVTIQCAQICFSQNIFLCKNAGWNHSLILLCLFTYSFNRFFWSKGVFSARFLPVCIDHSHRHSRRLIVDSHHGDETLGLYRRSLYHHCMDSTGHVSLFCRRLLDVIPRSKVLQHCYSSVSPTCGRSFISERNVLTFTDRKTK